MFFFSWDRDMFFRGNIHRDMLGMAPGDIFCDVVGFFMGSFIG